MTQYLGDKLISGVAYPTEPTRNLGQIIESMLPLNDAGLHLIDGSKILGGGIYDDFVTKIGEIYDAQPKYSNVTKIGALADNSGVLSGFSASNYATIPSTFSPNSNTWEIVVKAKFTSVTANLLAGYSNQTVAFAINASNNLVFNIGDGSAWVSGNIVGTTTFSVNTDYYFKLAFDGTTYKSYYSTDGETWTQEASYTGSVSMSNVTLNLGEDRQIGTPLDGSIDLNSCYINIDGSRWWDGRVAYGFTNEAQWQTSASSYGVCGKFVYDSVANMVRLPKITGIVEGTTDLTALGDLVEAGLPNITGQAYLGGGSNYGLINSDANVPTGSFYRGENSAGGYYNAGGTGGASSYALGLNASRSSSIYGNSNTVQPQTIKCYYYIVIATTTKTEIEVDIDEIATDLNGKADVDLVNCSNVGNIKMSHNAMPSDTYVNLTLGATGTYYTAPADGYVSFAKMSNAAGQTMYIGAIATTQGWATAANQYVQCFLPVYKGQSFQVSYSLGGSTAFFRFVYAVGSESEAS